MTVCSREPQAHHPGAPNCHLLFLEATLVKYTFPHPQMGWMQQGKLNTFISIPCFPF